MLLWILNFFSKWDMTSKANFIEVSWFFYFQTFNSDQITTLTYVLMDNYCPSFSLFITTVTFENILNFWVSSITYINLFQPVILILPIKKINQSIADSWRFFGQLLQSDLFCPVFIFSFFLMELPFTFFLI